MHYDLNGLINQVKRNSGMTPAGKIADGMGSVQIETSEDIPTYSVFTIEHDILNWNTVDWDNAGVEKGITIAKFKAFRALYTNGPLEIKADSGGWAYEIPYGVPTQLRSDRSISGPCCVDINTFQLTDALPGGFFAIAVSNEPDVYWVIQLRKEPVCHVVAPENGISDRILDGPGSSSCEVLMRATVAAGSYSIGDYVRTGEFIDVINPWYTAAGDLGDRLVQVDSHYDGANVVGWDCANEGTMFESFVEA